jgi:hypothetical protein
MNNQVQDKKNMPTFFLAGVMKSGTSSLTSLLKQHENVFCTPAKEPSFFSLRYERGKEYYLERYFSKWSGEQEVFEANPRNFFLPHVPHRIRETVPDPKFVVILRNPVDRAYSHWWMKYSSGRETKPFKQAIHTNLDRLSSGQEFTYPESIDMWKRHRKARNEGHPLGVYRIYVDMGRYDRHFERYIDLFSSERMHVVFLDDLKEDPVSTVRNVWRYLDLEPDRPVELDDEHRVGAVGENVQHAWTFLCRLGRTFNAGKYIPDNTVEHTRRWARNLFGSQKPEMNKRVRQTLYEYYRPRMRALSSMIDRDATSLLEG